MTDTHAIASAEQQDGSLRIVAYSIQNNNFIDTEETIFTITVQADEDIQLQSATSSFKGVLLATSKATEYKAVETMSNITPVPTSIQDHAADAMIIYSNKGVLYIQSAENANLSLVSLDGIQTTLSVKAGLNSFAIEKKGVYIINNQKVIIQ